MEILQPVNDACRLCDEHKEKMFSVFHKNDDGHQILHLIKECLPIIIFRTDPLSKKVCVECFKKLETFYKFKKIGVDTANRHIRQLCNKEDQGSKSLQLYLACQEENTMDEITSNRITNLNSVGTATDDLTIACTNCKSTCFDSSLVNNEVELCAELHKAIADSLSNNKVVTSSDADKDGRTRRRKSQAFYNELDDSLCSSLTEFTNTESSQCYDEYHSDMDSYDTDQEVVSRGKRRKLNAEVEISKKVKSKQTEREIQVLKESIKDEEECRYYPLSLMQLALNVVNSKIAPDHKPDDFHCKTIEPHCTYCKKRFKNSKLLALHEVVHINIELGEKVDNPNLWHESRDDASIRNKWLSKYDENEYDEECDDDTAIGEGLLIPIGTEEEQEIIESAGEIDIINGKPYVHGILLSDYSKEERKSFYKTIKVGGANKKFCSHCRYSFKDNWAIESHYFSLACYYSCRYCGMRFNKQRQRFDEHVLEHEERGDLLSTKIYAASKLNNFIPRVIQPEKVKKLFVPHEKEPHGKVHQNRIKNIPQRKNVQPIIKIKVEKMDSDDEASPPPKKAASSSSKATNQAYFCRKCYKVFFKLDEFNIHSKNCDYNQFPNSRNNANKFSPKGSNMNGELISPAGRPMRHCVREIGTYRDEAYIPEKVTKEISPAQQNFVCFICNTPFPTIYSRNSHMRIHKGEVHKTVAPSAQKSKQNHNSELNRNYSTPIKQEPLEPEVHIHETEQNYNNSSCSIGAVSITPISKNPNQKPTINPNIMKLVQNNPHLTIKANRSPERQPTPSASSAHNSNVNSSTDSDKSYKCSSCWEPFSNKSHLYFHKKNQCEGSKYPCPFCKKRFGTEAAYSSHIFYSHPE